MSDRRLVALAMAFALPLMPACMVDEEMGPEFSGGKADSANSHAASADRTSWSGYYWSMLRGELALGWDDDNGRKLWTEQEVRRFDACLGKTSATCTSLIDKLHANKARNLSPLMKYDLYVHDILVARHGSDLAPEDVSHASLWELENHYIGDDKDHRYWDSRGYAGKCIGWALSTMFWDEPTADVELGGILFRPGDIKGMLATIYNGAQFFIPEDLGRGTEFHNSGDASEEAYKDVKPNIFVQSLFETIDQGNMLEADMDPGDGVWNYPIHEYSLEWMRRSPRRVEVKGVVRFANDEIEDFDAVFSTDPERGDLLSRELTFDLNVPTDWDGDLASATGGKWTGDSVDDHPDAVLLGVEEGWRETIYDYEDSVMNTEVNFELIKQDEDEGIAFVDDLLERYYAQIP